MNKKPRSDIVLAAIGSAGDVFPFISLGREFQQRGSRVTVIANEHFKPLVLKYGMRFIELGTIEQVQACLENPALWHPIKGLRILARSVILPFVRPLYDIVTRFDPTRTIVVGSSLALGARIAKDRFDFPFATVHLQPALLRSVHEMPVFTEPALPSWTPRFVKRLMYKAADIFVIDRILVSEINKFRSTLGLPPLCTLFHSWIHSPQLVIGLFPKWFASPQPDWPSQTILTGFSLFDGSGGEPLAEDLMEFLGAGDPPVVFTPGTAMLHCRKFFKESIRACRLLGRRAMLVSLHRAQIPNPLPEGMCYFDYVPFTQVLPRAAALVHHGGIGTMSQGLAAGIPQLVMPMSHDQPDNAARLRKLGAGTSIRPSKYVGGTVARKLEVILNSCEISNCCRLLRAKIKANPRAIEDACLAVEGLVHRK